MSQLRKPLVAGNWKMNGDTQLISVFAKHFSQIELSGTDCVICPPAVYVGEAIKQLSSAGFCIAAQDVSAVSDGAHTGDISARMLAEIGCDYTIVGHSERRTDHQESSAMIAQKAKALLAVGITPIVCVGEPLAIREQGEEEAYVAEQLSALFDVVSGRDLANIVIAYEPIWAIGTGVTASPEQAQAMHAFIRAQLQSQNEEAAQAVRLLYGGSVKANNASELFSQKDIDGGLIGGASLKTEEFEAICRAANG